MTEKKVPFTLTKTANVEDMITGNATEIFEFKKVGGEIGQIEVARSELRDPQKIIDRLLDKNADLPIASVKTEEGKDVLGEVERAIASRPQHHVRTVAHLGWQENKPIYVSPLGTIGKTEGYRLCPPSWLNGRQMSKQRLSGNLEDWKNKVAGPCRFSDAATVAMCASFAAPLLKSTGLQSFGINLYGGSKAGKTTGLLAAASFAGNGRESDLPNHGGTPAAQGEQARLFNDRMLPMNEVGLVRGAKKDAYGSLRTLIYAISEGRDRDRHSASQYANEASSAEYCTIFVSTAEHSFDHYAKLAGQTRDPGEYARCTDVNVTPRGGSTIMDRVPKNIAGNRKAWKKRSVGALRTAAHKNTGHAFKKYIGYLISHSQQTTKLVEQHMSEFIREVAGEDLDGAQGHAAKNFALLYAGGRIGIEAGLLPWNPDRLRRRLVGVFRRSVVGGSDRSRNLRKSAKKILEAWVGQLEFPRSQDIQKGGKCERFKERIAKKAMLSVKPAEFRQWFAKGPDIHEVLKALDEADLLEIPKSKKGYSSKNIDWAARNIDWPNGEKRRMITFMDPREWPESKTTSRNTPSAHKSLPRLKRS